MVGLATLLTVAAVLLLFRGVREMILRRDPAWARMKRAQSRNLQAAKSPGDARSRQRTVTVFLSAVGGAVIMYLLFYILTGDTFFSVAGLIGGFLLPGWVAEIQATRLMIRISEQLDQAMGMVAAQLRQNTALEVAFAQAASSIGDPLASVFEQVVSATEVGLTFDQAVAGTRDHPAVANHPDYQVFVTQTVIAQMHGANITESFESLRNAISARRKYRNAVSQAATESLVQTAMMFALGLAVLGVVATTTEQGLKPLLDSLLGRLILVASILGNTLILRQTHIGMLKRLRQV